MHPSAGHASGTLVNAVLFHCGLPAIKVVSGRQRQQHAHEFCEEDESVAQDVVVLTKNVDGRNQKRNPDAPDAIRPGIVHRLDKGTTGLIVVAKDAPTHAGLCEQFAARTVRRRYLAIVLGTPDPVEGRVRAPIGRDPRDRLRMAVVHGGGGKPAASNYIVRASIAGGNVALLEWRLETGRTHQIRVHCQEIGHPIIGDDTYGGVGRSAAERVHRRGAMRLSEAQNIVDKCMRPMLHARTLGFQHPITGEQLDFAVDPPDDFASAYAALNGK